MTKITDRFAEQLARTPAPSEELIVSGAYPRSTGAGTWEVALDAVIPVLKGYFARSRVLSKGAVAFPNGNSLPSFFLTNEWDYADMLGEIRNAGDVYIGSGRALNFTFAAHAGSDHAFATDNTGFVPFAFVPAMGIMTAMAPTRAHFVSLATGVPLRDHHRTRFAEMPGDAILDRFERRSYDPAFSMVMRGAVARAVSEAGLYPDGAADVENILVRLLSRSFELDRLKRGLLSSEEQYASERDIFLQGRITGVFAGPDGAGTGPLLGVLKALNMSAGVVYISDMERHIFERFELEAGSAESRERVLGFYRELYRISRSAASNPAVVSALDMNHLAVFGLRDYIGMSIPWGADGEESARRAFEFFHLKRNAMAVRRTNNRPKMLLDMIDYELEPVPRHLVAAARKAAGGEPSDMRVFHTNMMSRSGIYRGLRPPVKRMFLLNMRALGVVGEERSVSVNRLIDTGERVGAPSGRGGYLAAQGRALSPVTHRPSIFAARCALPLGFQGPSPFVRGR